MPEKREKTFGSFWVRTQPGFLGSKRSFHYAMASRLEMGASSLINPGKNMFCGVASTDWHSKAVRVWNGKVVLRSLIK